MAETRRAMSPEEAFRKRYPNAFVDDDGEWVYIRDQTLVNETCPHCKQPWTHLVVVYYTALGSGNTEAAAFSNAVKAFRQEQQKKKR